MRETNVGPTGTEQKTYLYGDYIDAVLAVIVKKNGQTSTYYAHEGLNHNIEMITDDSGHVVERYRVDPFGAYQVVDTNWAVLPRSKVGNTHVFQGRPFDTSAWLYDFRNRWYSAQSQQFMTRDPLRYAGGDVNMYRFVGNDPVNMVDPLGLLTSKLNSKELPRGDVRHFRTGTPIRGHAPNSLSIKGECRPVKLSQNQGQNKSNSECKWKMEFTLNVVANIQLNKNDELFENAGIYLNNDLRYGLRNGTPAKRIKLTREHEWQHASVIKDFYNQAVDFLKK